MKKIMLLLALVGLNANATPANTIAQVQGGSPAYKTVSLLSGGGLVIEKRDGQIVTIQLSASNASKLSSEAEYLSDAELVTDHHPIVCMMMMPPYLAKQLFVTNPAGESRLVLSYQSCAIQDFTHPSNQYQQSAAETLESELGVLASQAVGN